MPDSAPAPAETQGIAQTPASTAPETSANAAPQRKRKRAYSRPEFREPVTLNSEHAQKVAGRNMVRVARALYTIDVILPIVADPDHAEQLEEIIDEKFEALFEKLRKDTARLEKRLDEYGDTRRQVYTNPRKTVFRISSPQLDAYARLIKGVDQIAAVADTLWLGGEMPRKEHKDLAYGWRTDLFKLAQEIITIEEMARLSANAHGHAEALVETDAKAAETVTDEEGNAIVDDEEEFEKAAA